MKHPKRGSAKESKSIQHKKKKNALILMSKQVRYPDVVTGKLDELTIMCSPADAKKFDMWWNVVCSTVKATGGSIDVFDFTHVTDKKET